MNPRTWRLCSSALAVCLLISPTLAQGNIDRRLDDFIKAQSVASGALTPEQLAEANRLLDEISIGFNVAVETEEKRHLDLLRIVGQARIRAWRGLSSRHGLEREEGLSERIMGSLRLRMGETFRESLHNEILLLPRLSPPELRAGAALLLGTIEGERSTLALLYATHDLDRDVRDCAAESVAGRDSDAVHNTFLKLLISVEAGELELTTMPLERHFQEVTPKAGSKGEELLFEFIRARLTANDWRTSSRAISMCANLSDQRVAPLLIEAMNLWLTRKSAGLQAARVLGELERALVNRSGLKLGQRPERWRTWWRSIKTNENSPPTDQASATRTQASFFGLRPMTDRVIFVLDGSGSMDTNFKSDRPQSNRSQSNRKKDTRFSEATDQLLSYLDDLGESTHFDVVIFNSKLRRFRGDLVPANERNLKSLREWIQKRPPDGGTDLKRGVLNALSASKPKSLEADTIIVLCDGETTEGPGWITPFMRSFNEEARVKCHAIQLGGRSDGALEALCEQTSGDYIEIRDKR
jgi:hypothetical protein